MRQNSAQEIDERASTLRESRLARKKLIESMSDTEVDRLLSLDPFDGISFTETAKANDQRDLYKVKRWVLSREMSFTDGTIKVGEVWHNTRMHIETLQTPTHRAYP